MQGLNPDIVGPLFSRIKLLQPPGIV